MIGRHAIHVLRLHRHAPEEIPSANNNGDLHPQAVDISQFGCDFVNALRIDTETLLRRQGLARKL
jgi:hypothetical protein